jgi:transketolase
MPTRRELANVIQVLAMDAVQRADSGHPGAPMGMAECLVIATGSEVSVALEAVRAAPAQGRRVLLVSMPCLARFDVQDAAYRESALPRRVGARVAVEAGSTGLWWRYVGTDGRVVGIEHFGASGNGAELLRKFGFTADNIGAAISDSLRGSAG